MEKPQPAILWPDLTSRKLSALVERLDETQFLPPAEREAAQYRQLAHLARFAAAHSRHFRARLAQAALKPDDLASPAGLRRLPLLSRRALQRDLAAMDCRAQAGAHGPFGKVQTSGSSGEPVVVYRSAACQAFWMGYTLREHYWHERDFSGRLAVIRANLPLERPAAMPDWGPPVALLHRTGPSHAMPINTDIPTQVRWLNEIDPHYLLVYPNNLAALLDEAEAGRLRLRALRQLRTIGETFPPELRSRARSLLGVGAADIYSSQELGMIAAQCPLTGRYHAMEGVIVEIVDDHGEPCASGAVGRVVASDLHNFAVPLIRYDIGDYAEAGDAGPCACGRGLHGFARVMGRERNMARLADGRRFYPLVGFYLYRGVADVRQYQIVQHGYERLEVRLVADPRPSPAQEEKLRAIIREALGHDFETVEFAYFDGRLPVGPNGKFEEFVCMLA